MTPVTFDGCFGWLHLPGDGGARRCRGVVLCLPHGLEALCVHRVWRGLAVDLAAAGLPTLRFDYHGTGDSLGDDGCPDRLRAWLDSIAAAAAFLRRHGGVDEVALVGLRLGATLAALAAREVENVGAVALIAPAVRGRAYLRELKALSLLSPAPPEAPATAPGAMEASGYLLTAETQAAIGRIDLARLDGAPAPRVLVLHRQEQPAEAALAAVWRAAGAEARDAPLVGYAEMMRDTAFATNPADSFALLVDWLGDGAAPATAAPRAPAAARLDPDGARETAVRVGPVGMIGVLTRPRIAASGVPAVLFLNTGANHRVGAGRMAVVVARRLAAQGVTSLRLDLSGLGDSPARPGKPDNLLYDDDAVDDTREALGWLEARGHRRVVVVGLCCGAFVGFHTAVRDPRIDGLVMINLPRFTAPDVSLELVVRGSYRGSRHYGQLLRRAETWARVLRGEVDVLGIGRHQAVRLRRRIVAWAEALAALVTGRPADEPMVMRGFRALAARGSRVQLVYSADESGLDELEQHTGRDARRLRALPGAALIILHGADHTLTGSWARERLAQLIETHLGLGGITGPPPEAPARAPGALLVER